MNQATAQALADGYAAHNAVGDTSVLRIRFTDGLVVEHWGVRDDAALLDSVSA